MEKQDQATEVKRVEVEEAELQQVAGGIGATWNCWFKGAYIQYNSSKHYEYGFAFKEMQCQRDSCFEGFTQCACHGTDRCVDKMHKMDTPQFEHDIVGYGSKQYNALPYPADQYDHGTKGVRFWTDMQA